MNKLFNSLLVLVLVAACVAWQIWRYPVVAKILAGETPPPIAYSLSKLPQESLPFHLWIKQIFNRGEAINPSAPESGEGETEKSAPEKVAPEKALPETRRGFFDDAPIPVVRATPSVISSAPRDWEADFLPPLDAPNSSLSISSESADSVTQTSLQESSIAPAVAQKFIASETPSPENSLTPILADGAWAPPAM